MSPRREILRRPRSVRLMVGGGIAAGLCALVVLVLCGVPWWHSPLAAYVINGASLLSAFAGVGAGAWRALATTPRPWGVRRHVLH